MFAHDLCDRQYIIVHVFLLFGKSNIYIIRFKLTRAPHASINLSLPTELVLQGAVLRPIWKTLESVFRLAISVIIIGMVKRNVTK